jgi:UDP-N-acetylglucosamine--N-acetylmuramyl-(pentapeptide) pyrophosphoryl-undecaprenol N-acetylglucosamine transferase
VNPRRARIGYYVHHHGARHAARAGAIAAELRGEVTLLSSLLLAPPGPRIETVRLPYEGDGGTDVVPTDLHFAPLGSAGLRGRMAAIAAWVDLTAPDLFVVDVSVEVAALVRLLGVPVVYVRQTGNRDDPAHQLAYRWSTALLAPFPDFLEPERTPAWVGAKTLNVGTVSRFDGSPRPPAGRSRAAARRVLVVGARADRIAPSLAAAVPAWEVIAPGLGRVPALSNLIAIDREGLTLELLASCAVVVAGAGANIVAEAAFARCGLICLPEPRPFDEQEDRAGALRRLDAAVVLDSEPLAARWPTLLAQAAAARERLALWSDGAGARRAAVELERLAQETGTVTVSSPTGSSQHTSPSPPRGGGTPSARA